MSGTWNETLDDLTVELELTEERREEDGWEGRVATPPVVSAEVTRESYKYTS